MNEIETKTIAVRTSDRSEEISSGNYNSNSYGTEPQKLLEVLKILPQEWALVAVGKDKAPLGKDWQNTPLTLEDFEQATQTGKFESLLINVSSG